MRIAAAAYPLDWHDNWTSYEEKMTAWVEGAADAGATLLVFPEYGAMELATLAGKRIAADQENSIVAVSELLPDVDSLFKKLAAEHGVYICAPTAPVRRDQGRPVNRARLITPDGQIGFQDKLIMTRFEREVWDIAPGKDVVIFD
ncbi:MAG: nitrilase-related carbon-nitrogen hydrolase, partial [Pseudomonadota bacterium]